MKKINIHLLRVGTSMLFVWGLIAAPGTAKAQGVEETCSNRTLRGDYGFTVDGLLLPSYIPLRGVALTHFDGNGKLSQIDHIIFNGFPPAQDWTPGTGTFHVNADCTGVMHNRRSQHGRFSEPPHCCCPQWQGDPHRRHRSLQWSKSHGNQHWHQG